MITVGVIPWKYVFPQAKHLFYSKENAEYLDFVSVHFYPKKGDIENALNALRFYDIGKPVVIEEMFPLECSKEEMDIFIEGSRNFVDGWISFYWGKSIGDYDCETLSIGDAIRKEWLEYFVYKGRVITERNYKIPR
ncbi:MAG: hypothetical protein BWY64_04038 [bacterium ADurb.Bin363]|nr:MAG: hypothetical protein BWY64_04038 [bacterium ADurb.Bin363]